MENSNGLSGKTALVTGGTSGIGFYTAHVLACLGAAVYISGRDTSRGKGAARQIQDSAGHENVHFLQADASKVGGNLDLARKLCGEIDHLHILVNNVGGLYTDRWETGDGYEATLAMNLIGPFALTEALTPVMRSNGQSARIVNVASAGYSMWKGDLFTDIHATHSYNGSEVYARSKYMNILWTIALARNLEESGITANAVHPGTAWTPMIQSSEAKVFPAKLRPFWPIIRLIQRSGSPKKAARTSIYLASAPGAANMTGQYFESSVYPKQLPAEMHDTALQDKTWELAERLVRTARTAKPIEADGARKTAS